MKNQISNLEKILEKKRKKFNKNFKKKISSSLNIITIASGKGGVGKTSVTVNLALALKKKKKKVLIFDGDFGMANVHILLGEFPKYNLRCFLSGEKKIDQIIFKSIYGIDLIPGVSAINEINNFTKYERFKFIHALKKLTDYDFILIDLPSGMSKLIIDFVSTFGRLLLVTTPEPTSLADSYGLLKLLKLKNDDLIFYTIFNRCYHPSHAQQSLEKIKKLCLKYLKCDVNNLGFILKDENLIRSIYERKPILVNNLKASFSQNIIKVTEVLLEETNIENLCNFPETNLI